MLQKPFHNELKNKLASGQKTAGAWLQIASPFTAEILARAGFDWLMIDMEHGPGDVLMLAYQIQAMNGYGAVPLVRAPWNDFVTIKRILDAGAYGVLIPYINTRNEAENAVKACKYPPTGIRGVAGSPRAAGYGQQIRDYLDHANDEVFVMVAIETGEAVENIDDILSVDGVDAVFIGPMDLATSLGQFCNPSHPDVQVKITEVEVKVLEAGKVLATVANNREQASQLYKEKGYQMLMLMADGVSLAKTAGETVRAFREDFC
jgi:2-keto-3-deoxy-L-rhamnonate aldolase RhmA